MAYNEIYEQVLRDMESLSTKHIRQVVDDAEAGIAPTWHLPARIFSDPPFDYIESPANIPDLEAEILEAINSINIQDFGNSFQSKPVVKEGIIFFDDK